MKYLKKLLFPEKKNLTEELSDYLQEIFDEYNISQKIKGSIPLTDVFWDMSDQSIFIVSKISIPPGIISKIYQSIISNLSLIEKRIGKKLFIKKTDMIISIKI
mgnify:CR=1 FL=1